MKLRFVLLWITLDRGSSTAILIGISSCKCFETDRRPRPIVIVLPRGFAVVFAEDVTDIKTTDMVSGESIYFVNARVAMLSRFKLLGKTCALHIMRI